MRWQYDANGKCISHVDLGGATVIYGYNGRGKLTSQISSARKGTNLAQNIVSTYDANGLLLTVDDRTSGIRTTYTYDRAGNRLTEKTEASTRTSGGLIPNGLQSPERTQLTALYFAVFDRAIDTGSRDFWVGHMQDGFSAEGVVGDFFDATEAQNLFAGTPAQFATALYQQALHRAPSDAEVAVIVNAFDGGTSCDDSLSNGWR